MTPLPILLPLLLLLCLALAGLSLALWLRLRRLQRLPASTAEAAASAAAPNEAAQAFAARLREAEIRSRLQQPGSDRRPPEKYRYAAALVARGLSGAEIAEILQLPVAEAEQIASLGRAAQAGKQAAAKPEPARKAPARKPKGN